MKQSRTKALAIMVAVVAMLLLGAEAVLRFKYGGGHPILVMADSAAGYILKPDQHTVRMGGNLVHVNSFGMRSDDVGKEKPVGVERILFIGDSLTYGTTHVGQSHIFTELVHQKLVAEKGPTIQVLNASASAWAPSNEVGYLESRGTFGADAVIFVLNSGDLPESRAQLSDLGDAVYTRSPFALQEAFDRVVKPKLFGKKVDKGAFQVPSNPATVQSNLELLSSALSYVRAAHARFAIVFIPNRSWIKDNQATSVPEPLVDWSKKNQVQLLDTTSALSSKSPEEITVDGVHLNDLGHSLVAQSIEEHWNQLVPDNPTHP